MVLLFQAQLIVVSINFAFCLLCLIYVSMKNVVNCIQIIQQENVNVMIVSVYLGIIFFHVIPEGELIKSNNVVLQNVAGLCLAIGFLGSILVYRRAVIPNTPESNADQARQVIPQLKYPKFYDPITLQNGESLTLDPSLKYPQYEWNNVPGLHCHPVYAVTQLETALASTPQEEESILQPCPIPRYIETEPQLLIQDVISVSQGDIEEQSYGTNTVLPQAYRAFLFLFTFHSIYFGVTLSIEKTVHGVAFISPAITICQTLEFIALILILKQAQTTTFTAVFALHVFPIVVLLLIFLQQSGIGKEEWENETRITLAILLLFGSGYLLFWCTTYLHHTVEKNLTNIAISCSTLVIMYVLSLFEKTWEV